VLAPEAFWRQARASNSATKAAERERGRALVQGYTGADAAGDIAVRRARRCHTTRVSGPSASIGSGMGAASLPGGGHCGWTPPVAY